MMNTFLGFHCFQRRVFWRQEQVNVRVNVRDFHARPIDGRELQFSYVDRLSPMKMHNSEHD